MNTDIKPNSHKYKENNKASADNDKKLEKVVTGTVKRKKKSEARKFADVFISEDAANVKNYILMDVLVPAIKKAISDIVTDGVDMILYGGNRRPRSSGSVSYMSGSYVSYNKMSERRNDDRYSSSNRYQYKYDDIILETRGAAEDVLERMDELLDMYNQVSVGDLYDLVGITGNYTDEKYGWTNLRNAEPVRVRDGYLLKLPKPGPLH